MDDFGLYIVLAVFVIFLALIAPNPSARKEAEEKHDKNAPEFIEVGGYVYQNIGRKPESKVDFFGREVHR